MGNRNSLLIGKLGDGNYRANGQQNDAIHQKFPNSHSFSKGVAILATPPFSIQEYRLISIGAFSLALEPWMGAGFVLAALVPPKKEGNAANERHYPVVCYGVFLSTTG